MAFNMDDILLNIKQTKFESRKIDRSKLFVYIKELDNVSETTRIALNIYLKKRLMLLGVDNFTIMKLNEMVTELLENCCGKKFLEIKPEDTDANFESILYHLKYAISHKFRYKIYHNTEINLQKIKEVVDKNKSFTKHRKQYLTKSEVEKIFEKLEVL